MSLVIHDVEQGSQEWLDLRLGIITASNAKLLLVNGQNKSHPFGTGALTYLYEKIAESFTGESQSTFKGNEHTQRGHDSEPVINQIYVDSGLNKGELVTTAGIAINHGVGASPDALVGKKGGLEMKALLGKNVVELLVNGADKIDTSHIAQCQCNMWIWNREWWDYMVYAEGLPPFVHRFYRDKEMIEKLAERAKAFYKLKNEIIQQKIIGV